MTSPANEGQRGREMVGLFFIPVLVAMTQYWAAVRVIQQVPVGSITDGIHYVSQAQWFQARHLPKKIYYLFEYGLYPAFLSWFDFSGLSDWSTATTHPRILSVYAGQGLLLSASTALFLFLSFRLIPGSLFKRTVISALLAGLLLSPLVFIWPANIMTETVALSGLLLFCLACLAYDAGRPYALVLLGLSCCLIVFVRDPIIFFVWIFASLLATNLLLARASRRLAVIAGLAILLIAGGLGYARSTLFTQSGRYVQTLVNVIQMRILPEPERREFFVMRGLPTPPVVMERSGHPAWIDNFLFLPDNEVSPDFAAYRRWVGSQGPRTYITFLLTHPGYVLRSIFYSPNQGQYGGDFTFSMTDLFSIPSTVYSTETAPYGPKLRAFLLAPVGWLIPMLYLAVVAARYMRRTIKRKPASSVEVIAIAAWASLFVSYHSDAWDIWRHTVPFVFLIYFSLIVRTPEIGAEIVGAIRRRVAGERYGSQTKCKMHEPTETSCVSI